MIKGEYKNISYKIKHETGKYKPYYSIKMGVTIPVSIEGLNIQCVENRYLVYGTRKELVSIAEKIIDILMKGVE